jgi:hypothetical protein
VRRCCCGLPSSLPPALFWFWSVMYINIAPEYYRNRLARIVEALAGSSSPCRRCCRC